MSSQFLGTPAKHPSSVTALVDRAWTRVSEAVFRTGWAPVARLAESAVIAYGFSHRDCASPELSHRLMQNITTGQLRVLTYSHIYNFPSGAEQAANRKPGLKAELRVVNDAFWVRLCAMGDLGFAEAYMYGDVECDDLVSLFLVVSMPHLLGTR